MTTKMVNPLTREELEAKWEGERISTQRFWLTVWTTVLAIIDFWLMKLVYTHCTTRNFVTTVVGFSTAFFVLSAIFYPIRWLWFVFQGEPYRVRGDWEDIRTWYRSWYSNHPQLTVLLTFFIPFTVYSTFFRFHDETIYQQYPPYEAVRVVVTDTLTGHQYNYKPTECPDDNEPPDPN